MSMEMNRRTFLKTTAAAAVAVSMTGLLGGCGGGSAPLTTVSLPGFDVSLMSITVKGGVIYDDSKKETLRVNATFNLAYTGSGFTSAKFDSIFSASIAGTPISLQQGSAILAISDFPLNKTKSCSVSFYQEAEGINTAYANGTPVILNVKLANQTAQFTYNCNKEVSGQFVQPQ